VTRAQTADSLLDRWAHVTSLLRLGSDAEDRARLDQLTRGAPAERFLLRSASSMAAPLPGSSAIRWALIAPELYLVTNSRLPYSLNDGALWAGRGVNIRLSAGVRAERGPMRIILAPELLDEQNREYGLNRPGSDTYFGAPPIPPGRNPYAYPWRVLPWSIDYPLRFGPNRIRRLDPGQSSIIVGTRWLETGIATENEWWGPGIRNALILSNNAPGFPHFFLRSGHPLESRIGSFEWRWLVGGLSESEFFDALGGDDLRSISALAVAWQPIWAPGLTLGAARSVYEPVRGWENVPGRFFRVFVNTGRPNEHTLEDGTQKKGPDQLLSFFGRWVLPDDGFEAYVEWGRASFPKNLRDFLLEPHHSQGYTLGLQYARNTFSDRARLRLQAELSNLEQSPTFLGRPIGTWYTSRAVLQGYTNRGQVLGAAIGPGASSQFLGLDILTRQLSWGIFASRIRWDNDAFYTIAWPSYKGWCEHDVSLAPGLRGGYAGRWGTLSGELTLANRLNVFFDNQSECPKGNLIRDERNRTLRVTLSSPLRW
jgi:hypothetical protein